MKTITLSLLALALLAVSAPLAAETLTCTPSQKFHCSPEGCKTAPAKVRAVIDMDKQTYSRCDRNGCDKYDATMSIGGIYLNVSVPGKSLVAKVEISSLEYFESVSIGLAVYNSFGRCIRK
jgi:hypothetical protein